MSAADRWCAGVPPQPPHVPTDALIDVTSPRPLRLCRTCWRRWTARPEHTKGEQ